MNNDIIFVLAGIGLAILVGYIVTHDIFVYKAENDAVWEERLFNDHMKHDCQTLQDKINKLETDDYWFNAPSPPLLKAEKIKCQENE